MKRPLLTILSLSLLALAAFQSAASAHAFLDHADPKVGAEVGRAPAEVRVWLTQHPEPAFSRIQVFDADGKEVDKKDSHVDDKDKSLLIVSLEPLPPGTYRVQWQVVSMDTHHTRGDFRFTVK